MQCLHVQQLSRSHQTLARRSKQHPGTLHAPPGSGSRYSCALRLRGACRADDDSARYSFMSLHQRVTRSVHLIYPMKERNRLDAPDVRRAAALAAGRDGAPYPNSSIATREICPGSPIPVAEISMIRRATISQTGSSRSTRQRARSVFRYAAYDRLTSSADAGLFRSNPSMIISTSPRPNPHTNSLRSKKRNVRRATMPGENASCDSHPATSIAWFSAPSLASLWLNNSAGQTKRT